MDRHVLRQIARIAAPSRAPRASTDGSGWNGSAALDRCVELKSLTVGLIDPEELGRTASASARSGISPQIRSLRAEAGVTHFARADYNSAPSSTRASNQCDETLATPSKRCPLVRRTADAGRVYLAPEAGWKGSCPS
jgi:hypothetical protein